jgi:hypothetical protein
VLYLDYALTVCLGEGESEEMNGSISFHFVCVIKMRGENNFQGNAPFPLDQLLCSVQTWVECEGIESFSMKIGGVTYLPIKKEQKRTYQ